MALPTKRPRDKALTIRVSKETYEQLLKLAERHNLSQGDVIEALIEQETKEQRRLRGKPSRYKRG